MFRKSLCTKHNFTFPSYIMLTRSQSKALGPVNENNWTLVVKPFIHTIC